MFMAIDDDEDSRSRIEDTSEDSDTLDSDSDYGEHFAAMLRNLINSGQLLLQSGEEDYEFPAPRRAPKIKVKPDTSMLDRSEFVILTKQACGLLEPKRNNISVNNVACFLENRESGVYRGSNFTRRVKCKISNQYIPNEMVVALENSTGKVFCGIFSPDGNTFLTASQDRHIRLYNSKDCSYGLLKSVRARDVGWSIIDVAFSPDGEHFVYSTWSPSLHMCPVNGTSDHQEPLSLLNTNRRFCVFSVVFSSDGKELVCGANDGCLYIYNIEGKKRTLKIMAHEYDINSVLFADNTSHIIYSGGDDGLVKVWDRRTLQDRNAKPVGLLAGHMDGITYIDSRGDGRHLISNSKDQSIKLWDVRVFSNDAAANESLKAVRNQPWDYRWQGVPKELYQNQKLEGDTSVMTYRGHVVSKTLIRARFSPAETTGQRFIYTGCGFGRVVIYDALTGKIVKQRKGHMACVRDVSWHPTRNEILSSSWDSLVGKWVYCKSAALLEKQEEKAERKPLRRSARLAALRQREQADTSTSGN
ncbi:DDB1- and CUL4-associated factor 11 isoform X2 [Euwallacea fornicatus]